jgi:hypothetical protein
MSLRNAPAFRVLNEGEDTPFGRTDAVVLLDSEIFDLLNKEGGPISRLAFIDAIKLAAALDGGYISADTAAGFLMSRAYTAVLESASGIINEGDRRRGEQLALRGVSIETLGQSDVVPAATAFLQGKPKRKPPLTRPVRKRKLK